MIRKRQGLGGKVKSVRKQAQTSIDCSQTNEEKSKDKLGYDGFIGVAANFAT